MGKRYNPREKRRRRQRYLKRLKERIRAEKKSRKS